jgi:Pyruvate/2-oxoacid:ferredoxin oxidoreductase gamma subunit
MEREIFLTGIGGQGVQLAARLLALAAMHEGRSVMSLGTYGGTMRGGNTDATVVVADGPIHAPPIVSRGWSAIAVHPRFFEPVRPRLREGGVVVFDSSLAEAGFDAGAAAAFGVDASALAREVEAGRAGSLVLLGAYCGLTGLVPLAALEASLEEALPPYRREHLAPNARALAAGHAALPRDAVPAWEAAA